MKPSYYFESKRANAVNLEMQGKSHSCTHEDFAFEATIYAFDSQNPEPSKTYVTWRRQKTLYHYKLIYSISINTPTLCVLCVSMQTHLQSQSFSAVFDMIQWSNSQPGYEHYT